MTDENGTVIIRFPRYAIEAEKLRPQALTCQVKHPDYADSLQNNVEVTDGQINRLASIKLFPGAQIKIIALANGQPLPAEHLYATWNDAGERLLVDKSGELKTPRISAGPNLFRFVYLPDKREPLFSEVQELELANGEQLELELEMKPGLTVHGRVAETIPRPVTGGRLVAKVITSYSGYAPEDLDGNITLGHPPTLEWQVWVPINEDGTFTLRGVPSGDLQVIALCDGYMAASGAAPKFASTQEVSHSTSINRPQVFAIDESNIHFLLEMVPTAECEITVLGPDQQPVPNVECGFWPNVGWWRGGSQLYCYPLFSTKEYVKDPRLFNEKFEKESPYSGKTDATGKVVIRGLPAGKSQFVVNHEEFELPIGELKNRYADVELIAGGMAKVTVAMQPKGVQFLGELSEDNPPSLTLFDNETTSIPKPSLPRTIETKTEETELAGVVIDESGQPLAGVKVDAWTWYPGNETETDDEGRFRLQGFDREESVEVLLTKADYSPSYFVAQLAGTDDWTIVLTQGTWLEGTVRDPSGEPVPNAIVKAARGPFRNPQVTIGDVTTQVDCSKEGTYRLHLEPGKYDVQVRVPGVGTARNPEFEIG